MIEMDVPVSLAIERRLRPFKTDLKSVLRKTAWHCEAVGLQVRTTFEDRRDCGRGLCGAMRGRHVLASGVADGAVECAVFEQRKRRLGRGGANGERDQDAGFAGREEGRWASVSAATTGTPEATACNVA